MKINLLSLLSASILITTLFSCQPSDEDYVDQGTIQNETYKNEEIGWVMNIPSGWDLETKEEQQSTIDKGIDAFEGNGVDADVSQMKILLNFEKNQFNNFQSTSEYFGGGTISEWKENNEYLKWLVFDTFAKQGIRCDTSSMTKYVDGLEFQVFHTKIYGPNGRLILEQDMCSRLINGQDFGATMSYNNDKDKSALWKAFKKSKFTKRSH